jgi:hypothetical protein
MPHLWDEEEAILTIISLSLGIVISAKDSIIEQQKFQIDNLKIELEKKCTNDTVRIIAPKDGDKVPGFSVLRGTIKGELPEGQYIWVVSAIDSVPGTW